MSKFDKAIIKKVGEQSVPKKYMTSKKVQLRKDFDCTATIWVAEAKKNKPCPMPTLTISIGNDRSQLVGETAEQIKDALFSIISFIEEHQSSIDRVAKEEAIKWQQSNNTYVVEIMDTYLTEQQQSRDEQGIITLNPNHLKQAITSKIKTLTVVQANRHVPKEFSNGYIDYVKTCGLSAEDIIEYVLDYEEWEAEKIKQQTAS